MSDEPKQSVAIRPNADQAPSFHNSYSRSLYDLSDCLAHTIGFLPLLTILQNMRISKPFAQRCKEALKQMKEFDIKNIKVFASGFTSSAVFAELVVKCPNIQKLTIDIPEYLNLAIAAKTWPNLKHLEIDNTQLKLENNNLSFAQNPIHLIVDKLPSLTSLALCDAFTDSRIHATPLRNLMLSNFCVTNYHTFGSPEEKWPEIDGLEQALPQWAPKIRSLCFAGVRFDYVQTLQIVACFPQLSMLSLSGRSVTDRVVAIVFKKTPKLRSLTLLKTGTTSQTIALIIKIGILSGLKISTYSLGDGGLNLLCNPLVLPKLRRIGLFGGAAETRKRFADRLKAAHPEWRIQQFTFF